MGSYQVHITKSSMGLIAFFFSFLVFFKECTITKTYTYLQNIQQHGPKNVMKKKKKIKTMIFAPLTDGEIMNINCTDDYFIQDDLGPRGKHR
jgi:hypothetical protein